MNDPIINDVQQCDCVDQSSITLDDLGQRVSSAESGAPRSAWNIPRMVHPLSVSRLHEFTKSVARVVGASLDLEDLTEGMTCLSE
jgi:hypothetical protein